MALCSLLFRCRWPWPCAPRGCGPARLDARNPDPPPPPAPAGEVAARGRGGQVSSAGSDAPAAAPAVFSVAEQPTSYKGGSTVRWCRERYREERRRVVRSLTRACVGRGGVRLAWIGPWWSTCFAQTFLSHSCVTTTTDSVTGSWGPSQVETATGLAAACQAGGARRRLPTARTGGPRARGEPRGEVSEARGGTRQREWPPLRRRRATKSTASCSLCVIHLPGDDYWRSTRRGPTCQGCSREHAHCTSHCEQ